MKAIPQTAIALALLSSTVMMASAQAETRAWLDQQQVAAGDSVKLNIETDQITASPDYAPLRGGFTLAGQSSSRSLQMINGQRSAKVQFSVRLLPHGQGTLTIPALKVGDETTEPLSLQVTDAATTATAPDPAMHNNGQVFIRTEVDDLQPYVQQSVGVVVRLYFAVQLVSGQLDLEQPQGASLQRVGDDINSVEQVNGRRYNVVERHFVLVPEHSGSLQLPGARFIGQGMNDLLDMNDDPGIRASAPGKVLQVKPQPDQADPAWLPLRDLKLRYLAAPTKAVAGEAVQVAVEATLQGATRAQVPELPVPDVAGAQVFAEPPSYDESFRNGVPQVKVTLHYSLVPAQAGTLSVPGLELPWWDVADARRRQTRLPELHIEVAPGQASAAGSVQPGAGAAQGNTAPAHVAAASTANSPQSPAAAAESKTPSAWRWILLAAGFALLWLLTLAGWLWSRRRAAAVPTLTSTTASARPRPDLATLRRALDSDGLEEIVRLLAAMAGVSGFDAVLQRLQPESQKSALLRMQRAVWAGEGDVAAARQAMREAFKSGPRWLPIERGPVPDELEPLYPRR